MARLEKRESKESGGGKASGLLDGHGGDLVAGVEACFANMEKSDNDMRFRSELKNIMLQLVHQIGAHSSADKVEKDEEEEEEEVPPAASQAELAGLRDEVRELKSTILSLQAEQSSDRVLVTELLNFREKMQIDLESLTQATRKVGESLRRYQDQEEEREELRFTQASHSHN